MRAILAIAFLVSVALVYSFEQAVDIRCPEQNEENATLIANPYCCTCYFACESGELIPMECPDGLHFDPELSVCNWPQEVNCVELEPPKN